MVISNGKIKLFASTKLKKRFICTYAFRFSIFLGGNGLMLLLACHYCSDEWHNMQRVPVRGVIHRIGAYLQPTNKKSFLILPIGTYLTTL